MKPEGDALLTVIARFPGGRFHATPWDHHVNEGLVEWPPSPWRLLRAFLATWHRKAREIDESLLREIVETLSTTLPHYTSPAGSLGHSRHYMPPFKGNTTKIFDSFVKLEPVVDLGVQWPGIVLSDAARGALKLLADRTGYLGRAESWVDLRLVETTDVAFDANILPLEQAATSSRHDVIRLLCPVPNQDFARMQPGLIEQVERGLLEGRRRKALGRGKVVEEVKSSKADRRKAVASIPKDLFDSLQMETSDMRRGGWNRPVGSRWVDYIRPRELLTPRPIMKRSHSKNRLPTVARFALASQVLPRLIDVVTLAERVRAALMSRSDGALVFAGKDEHGQPLRGHRHAFILPESNASHGRISHILVFAEMGFGTRAQGALDTLVRVSGRGGHDIQLVLLGMGEPQDFAGLEYRAGHCPLLAESHAWISRTPFMPTRHPKMRGQGLSKRDRSGRIIGSPEHDLLRLIESSGYPAPVEVAPVPHTDLGGKLTSWIQFRTQRKGHGRRSSKAGAGFRIRFQEAIRGPLAFGYAAHFGLGTFAPEGVYDSAANEKSHPRG